jgi:dihydrofolate reductase
VLAGLVDELQLIVAPVVLGAGRALFGEPPRIDLGPSEMTAFDEGRVFVRQEVKVPRPEHA